jgi:ribosomal protein S9
MAGSRVDFTHAAFQQATVAFNTTGTACDRHVQELSSVCHSTLGDGLNGQGGIALQKLDQALVQFQQDLSRQLNKMHNLMSDSHSQLKSFDATTQANIGDVARSLDLA